MLSFEALDILETDYTLDERESHLNQNIKNPLTQKNYEDYVLLLGVWQDMHERGSVTRFDIERLHTVREEFPHLEKFFKKHPINSFPTHASRNDYEISNENFIVTIGQKIYEVIKAVIKWIIEKVEALWNWFTSATRQSEKVETLGENLTALQGYLNEVVPILNGGTVSRKFKDAYKRLIDTQLHNINRNWNVLANDISSNPSKYSLQVTSICTALYGSVPDVVQNATEFIDMLNEAKTEQDVIDAVKHSLVIRNNRPMTDIVRLALDFGYNPKANRQRGVSEWQAVCQVILGKYRGMSNDRDKKLDEASLNLLIRTATISPWSDQMSQVEKTLGKTLPDTLKKLKSIQANRMNPGLEKYFKEHLKDHIPTMVSILQGFIHLHEAVALLAKTRDAAYVLLAKAALELAKGTDKFVEDNFDALDLSQQAIRKRHKQAVMAVFK